MHVNHHSLGRLERVHLRDLWSSEAGDFTPWLARAENLALLGSTIGLDLELDGREKSVGPFRADIVCKDTLTDSWVLIENQLERTDHSHLGQLLTYAAGLNAVTSVWLAHRFTEEHRAALDWLNEITDESVNFFGLEIELWRIGDSPIAPKFNIVSQPNDWIKQAHRRRLPYAGELSETEQLWLEYWTEFRQYLEENSNSIKPRKPFPQSSTGFAIGRSGFHLIAFIKVSQGQIGVALELTGPDAKAHFYLLQQEHESIEMEIGESLNWWPLPSKKTSYIQVHTNDFDPNQLAQWPQQHAWLHQKLEAFSRCFAPRIQELDAAAYISADEE